MDAGKTFQLGGVEYRLSKHDVEKAMQSIQPKPLGKYFVVVSDVVFPPKQVIAESLGKDLVKFTTMDATRILTTLGFEVQRVGDKHQPIKTQSELLFEQYLAMSGLSDFDYEREFAGAAQRPDYVVKLIDGRQIIFEVKEFRATSEDFKSGGGAYDPYIHIREKIQQAREKFKAFKDYCCCLVLFNQEKPVVDLAWQFVYGAMLGNLGFRFPVDSKTGVADDTRMEQTFMGGGSMIRYQGRQPVEPQNQTVSAVLVLDLLPVGRRKFEAYVKQIERERKGDGALEIEEYLKLIESCRGTDRDVSLMQLRAVVQENPYARVQLPSELFRGLYDERYGASEGRIQRLYAGAGIKPLASDDAF